MTRKKEKTIRHLLPCPSYDIERIESWLEDMAGEGLLLAGGSYATHRIPFLPAPPQTIRYRLEPKPKADGSLSDRPAPEALDLAEEYGWEFVRPFGSHYIYRTCQPDAREMNTDPTVQAAALKRVKRQMLSSLFWQLLNTLWGLYLLVREPYRFLVTFGWWYVLLFVSFFLILLGESASRTVYFVRLYRKLRRNLPMEHNKPWKSRAFVHKLLRFSAEVVTTLAVVILLYACGQVRGMSAPSTFDYPGTAPFPTLSTLYPDCTLVSAGMDGAYNRYTHASSNCCHQMLDWREYVQLQSADGQGRGSATLIVQYYDTAAPWLAQGLKEDYLRRESHWKGIHSLTLLPTPELDVDYVLCYRDVLPTIVLQHGNIFVQATCSEEALLLRWAQEMVTRLS